jgi:arginine dihydrolase
MDTVRDAIADTTGARILMCAPDHFTVSYSINPWMDPAQWAKESAPLTEEARREWRGLHHQLERLGATIALVPAIAELPDLVFTANAAVVMDGIALLARFRHPERQGEEAHFEREFRELWARGVIDAVRPMPDRLLLEGAGDCVWDPSRQLFWMGYGPRSQRESAAVVEATFGLETIALELVNPRFYHMDTAISPLPRGEVMYVPSAFSGAGLRQIYDRVAPEQRIPLSDADAAVFAANSVHLGDDIVLSSASAELTRRLEDAGYRVHPTPLAAFHKSGGSAFCLTLRLDRRSAANSAAQERSALTISQGE